MRAASARHGATCADTAPPGAAEVYAGDMSGPGVDWWIAGRARQSFLNALPIAAAVVSDHDGRIQLAAANPAFDRMEASFGAPEAVPFGDVVGRFLSSPDESHQFDWTTDDTAGARHFCVRLARLEPLADQPLRCLVSLVDRTAEVENERSLRAEMLHDSLTGLPNRVAFDEALEAVTAATGTGTADAAILVVNLARFSRINECMGSIAGDELIITVARRLVSTLRAGDVLARIGGDEFGVLMRVTADAAEAREAAKRIVATLSPPYRLSDLEIRIDCAVGCAMVRDGTGFAEDVVRNAQFACKRAKMTGGVEVYQPGQASGVRRRFSIETELRRAIEGEKLALAFQPLIDLTTGRVTGFESLARWTHEEEGPISPAEFIPVAEECGLIVPLGRWALDTALATLARWDRAAGAPLPLSVAVNLSAIQLIRDDVAAMVEGALAVHGIGGRRLTIELTESAIVHDPERAASVLQALKSLDCSIAMDDFGTGYSNLAYLQKLPIDVLKIDRSFVTGMLADRDKVSIVRAILGLADALGMRTTAEGIETVELGQTLSALGCNLGQGYVYGAPMPPADALACFRARAG